MKFSEKLTELRHSRGWSQEQLGERLGVTRQTVSKWELGSTTPELEKLAMMSDIFGVSTDELIKGEPQEASRPSEPSEPAEAIQDTKPLRSRLHFEYKSRRTVRGLPLVHINFGAGRYTAKGILTSTTSSPYTMPSPEQTLHLFLMILPSPLHWGHTLCDCTIPKILC